MVHLTQNKRVLQKDLKRGLKKQQHITDYAYQKAIKDLEVKSQVKVIPAEDMPGNNKYVCLVE